MSDVIFRAEYFVTNNGGRDEDESIWRIRDDSSISRKKDPRECKRHSTRCVLVVYSEVVEKRDVETRVNKTGGSKFSRIERAERFIQDDNCHLSRATIVDARYALTCLQFCHFCNEKNSADLLKCLTYDRVIIFTDGQRAVVNCSFQKILLTRRLI